MQAHLLLLALLSRVLLRSRRAPSGPRSSLCGAESDTAPAAPPPALPSPSGPSLKLSCCAGTSPAELVLPAEPRLDENGPPLSLPLPRRASTTAACHALRQLAHDLRLLLATRPCLLQVRRGKWIVTATSSCPTTLA
jgi:hypothetical protein